MYEKFRAVWTDERLALMDEMHHAGSGPKVIWEALGKLPGPKPTKPAVIGMRDRRYMVRQPKKTEAEIVAMLLARRERDMAQKRAKRAKTAKPRAINFNRIEAARGRIDPEPFVMRAVEVVPRHRTLLELEDGDCRFPYGDGPFTFCGNPIKKGSPYCGAHSALCFNGIPVPKRAPHLDLGKGTGGVFRRSA